GVRKNASEFPAELAVTVHQSGDERRFSAFIRDLTEVKRTEALLQEHQRRLAHVTRFNTLGELASGIAHELNQPLTAIANAAAIGLLADDVEESKSALRNVEKCVDVAGRLVKRFRKLAARSTVDRRICSLNEQITDVVELLGNETSLEGINVHTELSDALPDVLIDDVQIQRVLLNLLRNACESLADQPERTLLIRSQPDGDDALVSVSNSGPKLRDESVFEAFVSSKECGMGLGLSISRTIIEHHGGRIWLSGTADETPTTFCFNLPGATEPSQ
ncbi:MAG: ATP-binding protein, partial [Planctomycetota bacterium]